MLSRVVTGLFFAVFAVLAGAPAAAQDRGPVILAAASLQESLAQAANVWAARKHARPVVSFASTSVLAKQVEAGAPADIFISADEQWMDELAGKSLIRVKSRQAFLGNSLVLIAPASSTLRLRIRPKFTLAVALGDGRLAMADPDSVPAGRYGKASLTALGIWPSVEQKIARADNVRGALMLVERGEAPLGIVYSTDARASRAIRVLGTFPAKTHPPITYPLAILAGSTHPDAEGFRRFLLSREGKAIFARYGFTTR